jgi:hypothetical protein
VARVISVVMLSAIAKLVSNLVLDLWSPEFGDVSLYVRIVS